VTGGRLRRARLVCAVPGCVGPAVHRGRCSVHAPAAYAGNRERRAALLPSEGELARLRTRVRRRARGRCEACRRRLERGRGTVDHRVPLALGGPTELENLQLLCDDCERAKTRADMAQIRAVDLELERSAAATRRAGGEPPPTPMRRNPAGAAARGARDVP
jgi:5-methylcytosine-specific restriction endonuclease McrA